VKQGFFICNVILVLVFGSIGFMYRRIEGLLLCLLLVAIPSVDCINLWLPTPEDGLVVPIISTVVITIGTIAFLFEAWTTAGGADRGPGGKVVTKTVIRRVCLSSSSAS